MSPENLIRTIESESDLVVLDICDCGDSYIAECVNSKTGSVIGDFCYLSEKNKDEVHCLNPAVDPERFVTMMKNKKIIYQNSEIIEQYLGLK